MSSTTRRVRDTVFSPWEELPVEPRKAPPALSKMETTHQENYVPMEKQTQDWSHKQNPFGEPTFKKELTKFLKETTKMLKKTIDDTHKKHPDLFKKDVQ